MFHPMKPDPTKREVIASHGIMEARRMGWANSWDQLIYAARELAEELVRNDGIAQQSPEGDFNPQETALGFLIETLKEFKNDA